MCPCVLGNLQSFVRNNGVRVKVVQSEGESMVWLAFAFLEEKLGFSV